jgi:hypothetical protein
LLITAHARVATVNAPAKARMIMTAMVPTTIDLEKMN